MRGFMDNFHVLGVKHVSVFEIDIALHWQRDQHLTLPLPHPFHKQKGIRKRDLIIKYQYQENSRVVNSMFKKLT